MAYPTSTKPLLQKVPLGDVETKPRLEELVRHLAAQGLQVGIGRAAGIILDHALEPRFQFGTDPPIPTTSIGDEILRRHFGKD